MVSIPVPIRPRKLTHDTARKLDRLSVRAHRFHRFAHHPLCDRYAGEVVRFGRVRLCRGCTFALAGGVIGGGAGLALGGSIAIGVAAIATATLVLVATLYRRARVAKLVTRFVPAALFTLAITCGVLETSLAGAMVAAFAAAAVVGLRMLYGRRGADRSPCTSCPERELSPCSGFAPIVLRERAFQRVAARYLSDQAQSRVIDRGRSRGANRAIALARQPVLEIALVEPNDAAHLEHR